MLEQRGPRKAVHSLLLVNPLPIPNPMRCVDSPPTPDQMSTLCGAGPSPAGSPRSMAR